MATHPKGKNCPEDQKYDFDRGLCVNKGETVDSNDYPEDRNISKPNLDFTVKKKVR